MNKCALTSALTCTIKQALIYGQQTLAQQTGQHNSEALILLQHVTGKSKEKLIAYSEQTLDDELFRHYDQCLQRRNNGEPIAYIVEQKEFWSLPLHINSGVLIPRPETELIVETALNFLPSNSAAYVLDLGTGCGCIACHCPRHCQRKTQHHYCGMRYLQHMHKDCQTKRSHAKHY